MDGNALVEAVRDDCETELKRLGSDKALLAATDADLEPGPVLAVLVAREAGLRDTFEEWADEAMGDWATAFESAAERADERAERLLSASEGERSEASEQASGETASGDSDRQEESEQANGEAVSREDGESVEPADSGLVAELRDVEAEHARAGAGLVGAPLVADRTYLQAVSFFVNEADEDRVDLCRELRSAAEDDLAAGRDLLDARCGSDNDWERAQRGATRAIRAAYEEYAAALEAMGMDPRPIC